MRDRDWPLPANRLVSGPRDRTGRPACNVCGAEIDVFTNPCPQCGAPNPLITWRSIAYALLMLAGELAIVWLIVRTCGK
jgi:hypothetical protein